MGRHTKHKGQKSQNNLLICLLNKKENILKADFSQFQQATSPHKLNPSFSLFFVFLDWIFQTILGHSTFQHLTACTAGDVCYG